MRYLLLYYYLFSIKGRKDEELSSPFLSQANPRKRRRRKEVFFLYNLVLPPKIYYFHLKIERISIAIKRER